MFGPTSLFVFFCVTFYSEVGLLWKDCWTRNLFRVQETKDEKFSVFYSNRINDLIKVMFNKMCKHMFITQNNQIKSH